MNKKMRTCAVCYTNYEYCPSCDKDTDKPTWYFSFCSENCHDIYEIASRFENKLIDANTAKEKLDKLDLSRLDNFGFSYKKSIERINKEVTPVPQPEAVVVAESVKNEIKEEKTDETTVEENVLKKPRTRKARKDVE